MVKTSRSWIVPVLAGAVLLAVVATLGIAMTRGVGGSGQGRSSKEASAPAFTLARFTGESFALSDYADRPVFIYYWASWCIPCEKEAPLIERLWPEYRDRGWIFVGVNIWDAETDARRFIERHQLTFPLVRDTEGKVYLEYGVSALPTAFFVRPGQQMYARYDGLLEERNLRELLDEARVPAAPRPGAGP